MINIENDLILVKNEDKTRNIESCSYSNGKFHIKFYNNQKVFSYRKNNVNWYQNPQVIDTNKFIIYETDLPITGAKMILNFGAYFRVIFNNGFNKIYPSSVISLEETVLTSESKREVLDYLADLADIIGMNLDDGTSLLQKQYDHLTHISPRSVLATYLGSKPFIKEVEKQHDVIFPFGFNASQKSATIKAMTEQISVIEGPPGTGKTQTILNIIANAVINNKTVAIVSNNNSATSNVIEKLQKDGIDFIAAFLGNRENKDKFFEDQTATYPDMNEWVLEEEDYQRIASELEESHFTLDNMLAYQRKQAKLKQHLSEIKTEYGYFKEYYLKLETGQLELKSFRKINADKVLHMLVDYEQTVHKGKFTFSKKVYYFFAFGMYNLKFYKNTPETIISFLQNKFYKLKITELQVEIDRLQDKLQDYHFNEAMKQFSDDSMKLFKATLAKRFKHSTHRDKFTLDIIWKDFNRFIAEYPIILSTTHSLKNSAAKDYLFDYVLIDEASQVDIVTGALALSSAKNAVIVGDDKQLPNVVDKEDRLKTNVIYKKYNMSMVYNYAEYSLLTSILKLLPDVSKTLLQEHYRCHPKIIGYCNQKFYQNELVVLTEEKEQDMPLIVYKTVKGNHARGTFNQRQIDVVMKEVMQEHQLENTNDSVGIITPYRLQAKKFDEAKDKMDMDADTVHKYQGREKDVIILSTVVNDMNKNDFADDPNLINVAVSRAVKKLIIVTAEGSEQWHGTNVGDLIGYIKYNNHEIINSEIHSVFDYLYSCYADKLSVILEKNEKVSEHTSENLMNIVIERILSEAAFQQLDYVLHQPLRMIIKDLSRLSEAERLYTLNEMTHTDFMIFNKLNKMPVLVVEVDGHAYHADNPKQLKRDQMKDTILDKYDIPIIRLKTTGSEEERILRDKLASLMV